MSSPPSPAESLDRRPIEPPRRSRVVDLVMWIVGRLGRSIESPHGNGGTDDEKLWFEYRQGDYLFSLVSRVWTVDLRVLDDKDVLDVGIAWGGKDIYYAEHSKARTIIGFDLPGEYLPSVPRRVAAEKGIDKCRFLEGYAEDMPVDSESIDVLLMEDVMEHVQDPALVLKECFRVLRPGGLMICRFPSIKMLASHHFDRAASIPGLHYLMPMRRWAAGFNYYRTTHSEVTWVPFRPVRRSQFGRSVTSDLNGMSFDDFRVIVAGTQFNVVCLELAPIRERKPAAAYALYRAIRRSPLREAISSSVVFVAEKPGLLPEQGDDSRAGRLA